VRLLLTLGANPAMVDYTHGNTALHWAILARNATAISTLVLKSKASLDVPNLRGETPLSMLESQTGAIWIGAKVMDRVKEAALTSQQRRSLVSKLRHARPLEGGGWTVNVTTSTSQCESRLDDPKGTGTQRSQRCTRVPARRPPRAPVSREPASSRTTSDSRR